MVLLYSYSLSTIPVGGQTELHQGWNNSQPRQDAAEGGAHLTVPLAGRVEGRRRTFQVPLWA